MISEKKISEYYRDFSRELYIYIYRYTGSRETTEDILHDCYANLIQYSMNNDIQNVRALLYKTAHNLSLNYIRKHSREAPLPLESNDSLQSLDTSLLTIESDELSARIYQLLEETDAFTRSIFVMRKENNLSLKEIADITGRSERTVRRKLTRFTEYLHSILEKEGLLD